MSTPQKSSKRYGLLYGAIILFSFSSVFSKLAAGFPMLSLPFLCLYGFSILTLGFHALVWQQVLKWFPLSTAYANKHIATVLTMVWGIMLFGEPLTWNMIVGTMLLLVGIGLVVWSEQ